MVGHYVRVQEASALLGVSPATIRWYSLQGWLPTYRVGRGQVAHRRFRYPDLQHVAIRTGRYVADEPAWDRTVPITVEMAAQYLGLSARYLTETGAMSPGTVLNWEGLTALEQQVYPGPEEPWDGTDSLKEAIPMMREQMMMNRACGCRGGRTAPASGEAESAATPKGGWPSVDLPAEGASLLALRRTRRHLEVQKADLEDQLAELERRIQAHPENHG